ncbi:MAG: ribosomal large subunit pseudouridine synthase D [Chlorobi bacterium OLB7]|nr:MAG: ribosomal large subunit pseudouridine synthase D [Chlorobi bacterium OLB7]
MPTDQYPERIPQTRLLTVAAGQAAERIDIYLTRSVLRATRNKVQEAIAGGAVLVNGRPTKSNYKVRPGDVIQLTLMKPPPIELIAQDIPLDIVHEDADVLVINKPAGLVTHPAYATAMGPC